MFHVPCSIDRLMESDLSLIEITGEDDSLLQQIPADEIAAVNSSPYFSCSPIQIFRPRRAAEASRLRPTEDLKSNRDADKPSCSSSRDVSNKENVNENKFGVPKLSVEPQQMKKRKKGGGYNLRKSLAWDRAFFTEEGVLNPLELSMVSGNCDTYSGEGLSVINEEETKSVSGNLDCPNDSAELQALEEKLFKELPISTSNGGKSIGGCTQPMQDSPTRNDEAPAPAVMRKVLSVHDANRSGSKRGGFSRPLSSTSRKRQANATTKAAPRDAKLPKAPVSKPDPCLLTMTTNKSASLSTIHLKRNHIAQPGVIVPKSAGLKGSSSKFTSAQNNAKLGPDCTSFPVKSSVLHARRNVVSTPQANPPSEINSSANVQPQLVTKVNGGLEVTQEIELPAATANRERPSISGYSGSNKTAVSLPQNAQYAGGNLQYGQPQTTKPSGLRMPSPSLGLFSQPKASTSLSQKNQTCNLLNSVVPNFQKLHASNSIQTGNITALTSNARFSISSAAKPVLPETVKLNFEVNNLDKSKVKFPCAPKSSEVVKDSTIDCVDRKRLEHAEPHNIDIPCKEDSELQINDHKLLLQSASCKLENSNISSQQNPVVQVRYVCETDDISEHQIVEETSVANQHGLSESGSGHTINCSKASISVVNDGQLVTMLDTREQSREQADITKCCAHDPDLISLVENKKIMANNDISFQKSSFEESQNYVNGNIVDTKVQGSCTSTLESCQQPSQCTKESGKDATEADEMINESHEQDAPTLCLNWNLLVESCKKNLSTCSRYLIAADDLNEQSGEQKPQNPLVEWSYVEDTPFAHEVKLNSEVISMEFDSSLRISKDQTPCEVTTLECTITNFHPESRDSNGSELEGAHSTFLFSPEMQVESVCGTEKMIEYQHMEERKYNSPVKNQAVITNAQCGDTIDGSKEVALVLQNNQLSCMPVANESSEEQTQLIKCCSSEADQISNNENQKLHTEDSISSRSSQKNNGCVTDINPNICGYNVSELESFDGPSQVKYMVQGKKKASRIDSTTKNSPETDAGEHSIDSDLLVEGCRSNLSWSAVQNQYILGSDLINEQSSEQMKLQIPCLVVKQSSQDEHGLCLNNCSLFLNNASSNEFQEENDTGSSYHVLPEQSHLQESVPQISSTVFQLPHGIPDDVDVEKITKHLNAKDALPDPGDFKSSFEGHQYLTDTQLRHGLELNSQATFLENDSSLKLDEEKSKDAVTSCRFEEFHSSSNKSGLLLQHVESSPGGSIQQCGGLNGLESGILPEKVETKICQDSNSTSSEPQHQLNDVRCSAQKDELVPLFQEFHSSSNESGLSLQHVESPPGGSIQQCVGLKALESGILPEKAETKICQDSNGTSSELQHQLDDMACSTQKDELVPLFQEFHSSSNESGLSLQHVESLPGGSIQQCVGLNGLESGILPEKTETKICQDSNSACSELQHQLDNVICSTEKDDKKSETDTKRDDPVIKPPLGAVPFSDDWLTAIEAAGEEILTLKSGAVQNSPPDKSLPEPGPWSPVRKKANQEIGPFDCTKKFSCIPPANSN